MDRSELLQTAESLRETTEIAAAEVVDDWGSDDKPCLDVRADNLCWEIQRLIRDGGCMSPLVDTNDDGTLSLQIYMGDGEP